MYKVLAFLLLVPALHAQNTTPKQIRLAAGRAIAITQRGSAGFYKFMNCFSCHASGLPMLALRMAREKGIPVEEPVAAHVAVKGLLTSPDLSSLDQAVQDPTIVDPAVSEGWALVAAHAAGLKRNLVSEVYARRVANWQRKDGHWPTVDDRPPQSYSLFTATAVALRAMQLDMPVELRKEKEERLARARKWLLTAQPHNTEDYTFRLFGLYWAGARAGETRRAAADLLALQRPDGGWAELPHMQPDAYSTGEALVALNEGGGVPVSDPAWQKGLRYLLSTQEPDGSWHVHTRMLSPAPVSPPYFETGFPYGHDQFLSTDATCWAAMALMLDLPNVASPPMPAPLAALMPKGLKPWMETALFGTAAELKARLDAGLDPNSKTAEGTTLLMMASPDPGKVKLLIERGADVRARAKTGYTALMVATTYLGTSESVELLLAHGAAVRPGAGVVYDASPLFLAATAGDPDNIALLLAQGADPSHRMNVIGMFPTSPLIQAVGFDDAGVVQALIAGRANVHERDSDGMTPLDWAVIEHHLDAVKALLAAGADVNTVDRYGYTPLLYSATIDFGDGGVVKALLRAGANRNVQDKQGRTPLWHAQQYPYIRTALEKAIAKEQPL